MSGEATPLRAAEFLRRLDAGDEAYLLGVLADDVQGIDWQRRADAWKLALLHSVPLPPD